MFLSINQLNFSYKQNNVLANFNLQIPAHSFTAILGFSGCGKSSLLKCIAGIIKSYQGEILINNRDIKHQAYKTAYMPQQCLLFPWLTVKDNLKVPLMVENQGLNFTKKNQFNQVINHYLQKFNLTKLINKYPHALSGGEQSRIALLRTILIHSNLMLLDEPFAKLDYLTKQQIHLFLYDLYIKNKYTILLVTHDIDEAILLADNIYIISQHGEIIKNIAIQFANQPDLLSKLTSNEFIYYKKTILKEFQQISQYR